jgi:acyl dehydratase
MRFAAILPGMVIESGPRLVSADEIIQFASRYDPQWFHVNPERAAKSRWGGLIASGWHSCAIVMEMTVAAILEDSESFGSPGIEQLQWLEPVRPGDALRLRVEVLESRISASGRTGIVRWRWELLNQTATKVLTLIGTSLFAIEPGPPPLGEALAVERT